MKRVIINADDFGLSQGVNEGIIRAHREGVLSSATLMANAPGFEHAVKLAGQNRDMGVGVHLNILRGKPLSTDSGVESLLSGEGQFCPSVFRLYRRLILKKISLSGVEKELRTQIEKIMNAGIVPSHLDSEKHVHMLGPLFDLILKLAKEYGIRKVRFIKEYCFSLRLTQMGKSVFISLSSSAKKKRMEAQKIMSTDYFLGICNSGRMSSERLKRALFHLREGITEIMVHPGFISSEMLELEKTFGSYYINKYRELELTALLDEEVNRAILDREIRLINFNQF